MERWKDLIFKVLGWIAVLEGFDFDIGGGLLEETYGKVSEWLAGEVPLDYFDFPASAAAFCLSLNNSEARFVDNCLLRRRGDHYKLITFRGSAEEALQTLQGIKGKVKSLTFAFRERPQGQPLGDYEYYVDTPFVLEDRIAHHSGKHRYVMRRDYRLSQERYEVGLGEFSKEEVRELWDTWTEDAKDRHFMLFKGHYLAYLDMYFAGVGNIQFLSFRRKSDGVLWATVGFEVKGDKAQITVNKHQLGDNSFAVFGFAKTLEWIGGLGVSRIICGDTIDVFKQKLGLDKRRSWRFVL